MKKEAIIAVTLGFGLGLVITFGIWTANRAFKEEPTPTPTQANLPTPEESPTPTPEISNFKIDEPEDGFISAKEEITLTGSALPEAVIVVFYEEGEKILETDNEGNFETSLSLIGGVNKIIVKAFDEEGNEAEKTLTVVYSTAEI